MKGFFTKIAAVVLGLSMATGVGVAVAVNTSSVLSVDATDVSITGVTNASSCSVDGSSGIKVGTSSKGGAFSITVPNGAQQLSLHAGAWKGVSGLSLTITSNKSGASIAPSSIALTADAGFNGNSTSFSLDGSAEDYLHEFVLSGVTSSTTFTFTTSTTKRCVAWGASYSTEAPSTTVVTFTPGTDTGETTVTKGGVKAAMSTMNNASYYQIFANSSATFSSTTGLITRIEFSCTASGTSKYGPGNASANVGTYTYSGANGIWTSNPGVTSVTISSTAQVRMTTLAVTLFTGPAITNVAMTGSPAESEVVLGGAEMTMSATVTAKNDSGSTLSRNVNWSVSPAGAVTFSKSTSASGEEITVTAANANASNVVITAASAAEGFTNVKATSHTFSVIKKGVVTGVTVATSDGQTTYDAQGATSYTVSFTTAVTYSGASGSNLVDLSVSPDNGVTLSGGKNFEAGTFTANFSIEGTYTITSTSVEDSTKSQSVTITVNNISFVGYELITSTDDIVPSKGRYVFYFIKNSLAKSISTASVGAFSSNHYSDVAYTAHGTIIPSTDVSSNSLHVFSFESAVGGYYLKDVTNGKYLKTTDTNNGLSQESDTSTAGVWNIQAEDGIFRIYQSDIISRWFEYNNDSKDHRITCYAGTQHSELYLYKLNDESKSFVLDETNIYTSIDGDRAVEAVAKNGASATVSWSIADTSIAKLESTYGLSAEIEGVGLGQTTLTAHFTALDGETYPDLICTINVIDIPEHVEIGVTTFTRVTSKPSGGWDGVYLFVDEHSGTVLDGSHAPVSGYRTISISGSSVPATIENLASSFMISAVGSNYTINSYSDNYIGNWHNNTNSIMSSYIDAYEVTISDAGLISALLQDGTSSSTELKAWGELGVDDNYGIKFYKTSTTTSVYPISLYKADGEIREISSTLKTFYENNKANLHCVDTSKTQGSSTINWSAIKTAYNALGSTDKGTLTNMAARAAELKGNYLEAFISRYDYCVAKLGYEDFMGREQAGTLSVAKSSNSMISFISEAGDAGIVIAVASLLGLSVITGYFFVRKRKAH